MKRFCSESQLPYTTLPAVVCIFVTAHLCIFVHTSSNKSIFLRENIDILGTPLSAQSILHFLLHSFAGLWRIQGWYLRTDILCWLSLLGSIFTPRDLSSVIFFTVEECKKSVLYQRSKFNNNTHKYYNVFWENITHVSKPAVLINCLSNCWSPANLICQYVKWKHLGCRKNLQLWKCVVNRRE